MQGVSCWLLAAKKPPDGNIPARWSYKKKKKVTNVVFFWLQCYVLGWTKHMNADNGWMDTQIRFLTEFLRRLLCFWGSWSMLSCGFNYEQIEVNYYVTKCVRLVFPCCYLTVNDFRIEHLRRRDVAFPLLHTRIYVRDWLKVNVLRSAEFGVAQSFSPILNFSYTSYMKRYEKKSLMMTGCWLQYVSLKPTLVLKRAVGWSDYVAEQR